MNNWPFSILSLLYLAFHVVALILSAAFWKRCPKACAYVMAGGLLNVVAAGARIASPMFFQFFRDPMALTFFHLAIGIVNLIGSALYLTAVFVGRSPVRDFPYDDDDDWDRPASLPKRSESRSDWFREPNA